MHNSKQEWEHNYQYLESTGSINLDHLTFDDVPDLAPSTASPKASCSGPKGSIGKAIRRRSRASKKAPTTLLTADADNFRALVQKFTGWHSATSPLQRAYKGPINLNFEQCSYYYPNNLEQKKQKQVDCKPRVHEKGLDRSSVCRNINMGGEAFADLDRELFGQNPRDDHDHDHALTYDHGLDMDSFLGTADYSTILSETMDDDDDEIWGYHQDQGMHAHRFN